MFAAVGCSSSSPEAPIPSPIQQPSVPVVRGAVGNDDARAMVSELMASKACEGLRGSFRSLRSPKDPNAITGVLWVKGCEMQSAGTGASVQLSGDGWQWADEIKHQAGGTFAVREYLKFHIDASLDGSVDFAFDRGDHVASTWFTPSHPASVAFTRLHDVSVDKRGAWSTVLGLGGRVVGQNPNTKANAMASEKGRGEMQKQLDSGFSATVALCTGTARFGIGRYPKGQLIPPDTVESAEIPVQLEPGGLGIFGPQLAPHGEHVDVVVTTGAAKVSLACQDDARPVAEAFLANQSLPAVKALATAEVHDRATLIAKPQHCPVVVIVEPLAETVLTLQRPAGELAASFGGPMVSCGAKQNHRSAPARSTASAARPAARPARTTSHP